MFVFVLRNVLVPPSLYCCKDERETFMSKMLVWRRISSAKQKDTENSLFDMK